MKTNITQSGQKINSLSDLVEHSKKDDRRWAYVAMGIIKAYSNDLHKQPKDIQNLLREMLKRAKKILSLQPGTVLELNDGTRWNFGNLDGEYDSDEEGVNGYPV